MQRTSLYAHGNLTEPNLTVARRDKRIAMLQTRLRAAAILPLLFALAQDAAAQTRVTSPEQQFGHPIGADYVLPDYTAFMSYWQRLAGESDRMVLDTIGTTANASPRRTPH